MSSLMTDEQEQLRQKIEEAAAGIAVDGMMLWGLNAQIALRTTWAGRDLLMTITPAVGTWIVIAIETKKSTTIARTAQDVEAVLDGHAHHTLGLFESLAEATAQAESYAKGWLYARGGKACECGPILGGPPPDPSNFK